MKTTPLILAMAFVASTMVAPVSADPPGNYSVTFEFFVVSYFDFKDGVGIYDSGDPMNAFSVCVLKLLGLRGIQPLAITWEGDQNMGTNLNGPAVGISDLGLSKPGGIDTGIPCPAAIGGTDSNIFITFSGMNWRSYEHDSAATLTLCTQKVFASSSPGCLAFPTANMRLWASACIWPFAFFGGDYADAKGKYLFGEPWDTLQMKSDVIKCQISPTNAASAITHSHDYTATIQDFTAGGASQTFDLIKNEAVVHAGSGNSYMVVCWQIDYLNFSDPLAPAPGLAQAHDWKLILDAQGGGVNNILTVNINGFRIHVLDTLTGALLRHYGGAIPGDNDVGGAAVALRGFYSLDSGDPKDGGLPDGQNGFGPCTLGPDPEAKKPVPLI